VNASLRSVVFGLAIFGSATLLFLVQPLVGKRILPWFGGAPAVWSLCLAFYQSTLFLGYAYAHGLIRWACPKLQVGVHFFVLGLAALLLPILPGEDAKPNVGAAPESEILTLLIGHVGLPFLALAATGPLVQVWFARCHPNRSPYFLYAISNVGSLLGLLGYSFFLEATYSVSETGALWSGGFLVCSVVVLFSGWMSATHAESVSTVAGGRSAGLDTTAADSDVPGLPLIWLMLSGCAVILLTGLTNQLTLDVASLPFLWVGMLAAYLASFILAFASERAYSRPVFLGASAILLVVISPPPFLGSVGYAIYRMTQPVPIHAGLYGLLLFSLAMVLHGELYRLRPSAAGLTRFYLYVSGGGALGGLFAGILAPHVFNGFQEILMALGLGWLTVCFAWQFGGPGNFRATRSRRHFVMIFGTLVVLGPQVARLIVFSDPGLLHEERGFFGVLKVRHQEIGAGRVERTLMNGTTVHGRQLMNDGLTTRPTSYYGAHTGIGFALSDRSVERPLSLGIVGLGIGTLAAYGRDGDEFRFYEIDPAVTRIARDDGYFSYLAESAAEVIVVPGDARLSLVSEAARDEKRFDLLVVDAFTSDSIPLHLMTQEAFALYRDRLGADGMLAIHISNQHFRFDPVIVRLGRSVGLESIVFHNHDMPRFLTEASKWVFLSRDRERLARLTAYANAILERRRVNVAAIRIERIADEEVGAMPLWTDDYSDLFATLK
jgi:hypothetical protein